MHSRQSTRPSASVSRGTALGLGSLALAAALVLTGCAPEFVPPTEVAPVPCADAQLTVLPHPDDEWQTWGLVEALGCKTNVAVTLTRGEQSGYCDSDAEAGGRFSDTCVDLRLQSWLAFYEGMPLHEPAQLDDPAAEDDSGSAAAQPTAGAAAPTPTFSGPERVTDLEMPAIFERDDDGARTASADPLVWHSEDEEGWASQTLIAFDLGDGDLTDHEVVWAVEQILDHPEEFGLDPEIRFDAILSSYAYTGDDPACFPYDHPDHNAAEAAVQSTIFDAYHRYGADCRSNISEQIVTAEVSEQSEEAAFGEGDAFKHAYGWLGDWMQLADRGSQDQLFQLTQTYWVREASA